VNQALRRLYRSPAKFGKCEHCGEDITFERLTRCRTPACALSARRKKKMASAADRRLFWGTAAVIVAGRQSPRK